MAILRTSDVTRITGLSRTTLWRMERRGEFPHKRRISKNAVAWLASEIKSWMAERIDQAAA